MSDNQKELNVEISFSVEKEEISGERVLCIFFGKRIYRKIHIKEMKDVLKSYFEYFCLKMDEKKSMDDIEMRSSMLLLMKQIMIDYFGGDLLIRPAGFRNIVKR